MDRRIRYLILLFGGYSYETAGHVVAFFPDPLHAKECAGMLEELTGTPPDLSGSQFSFQASLRLPFRVPLQRQPEPQPGFSEMADLDRDLLRQAGAVPEAEAEAAGF